MIKKFLQKVFKFVSYGLFFQIYGKIDSSIKYNNHSRIEFKQINFDNNLTYNVYSITDGRLYTDRIQDTAVLIDNSIIDKPSFQLRQTFDGKIFAGKIDDNIVFKKGTPRILKKINGNVLSLLTGGGGNDNYWHWLTDVLPRLNLYSKVGNLDDIDFFLFPSLNKKFQIESLDLLKIPNNKRISSEKFRHIKANKLLVTDHPVVITGDATHDIQNVPSWIIRWLKDSFVNKNYTSINKKKNKIYIDRNEKKLKNLPQRDISNENEVKNYLLEKEFMPAKLSNMKFIDQINLFYNAQCVVGLHGAGFGNLAFCQPRTKVIELRSSSAGPMYENYSKKNNLDYYSIITESQPIYKSDYPNQQGSIKIEINQLAKIIEN